MPDKYKSAQTSIKDNGLVRTEFEGQLITSDVTDENNVKADPDVFIIDTIMSYKFNSSNLYGHAKLFELLYRVR